MKNGLYIMVVAPDEYPGKKYRGRYCYEHQLVWWKNTGNVVPAGCVIHHKNEIKTDNRFENLSMMTASGHTSLHGSTGTTMVECKCFHCGEKILRRKGQEAKAKGYKRSFCSRKCMAKSFGRGRKCK